MVTRTNWATAFLMAGKVGWGGGPEWQLQLYSPNRLGGKPEVLEERIGDHDHEGMVVQPVPDASFVMIEPEFLFHLLMRLLADPPGLDLGREIPQRRAGADGWKGSTSVRPRPGALPPATPRHLGDAGLPWSGYTAGPSATRTRMAANSAESGPLVPFLQLIACQAFPARMHSAATPSSAGMAIPRGRPRPALGQIISISAG